MNQRTGILEFLVVHEDGKTHESLFRTVVSPLHLNLALKLLRYAPSKKLYRDEEAANATSTHHIEENTSATAAASLTIFVEVKGSETSSRVRVNDWIHYGLTGASMPASSPWVYGGSRFSNGKFMAQQTGDIAAIYLSNAALINYLGNDNLNDEVWTPFTKRIPMVDTEVTLTIAPYQEL